MNNTDFRRITHTKAVRILRTHRHMSVKVRHVGKLPYARRLTPSTLSPSSSLTQHSSSHPAQDSTMTPGNHHLQSLFTNAALLTDPAEEEIDRLTREAMFEQTGGIFLPTDDQYYLMNNHATESSLDSMPYESYMLDLELDEEVLRLKQKMKEKRDLMQYDRPLHTTGLVR